LSPSPIPPGVKLRVVADTHGDARAFSHAVATDRFVIQLGDLTDYGPDSAGCLRTMIELIDRGAGLFVVGNHDVKLARALAGRVASPSGELLATLAQLDPALRERALAEITAAPAWLTLPTTVFVHGGFHTEMLLHGNEIGPPVGLNRPQGPIARALYGEPTGRTQANGYPERSLRWVDRIPAGVTVYCGHDRRSTDGRPYRRRGALGGVAVFVDTGAGKGGHLSWIDLPPWDG